jgi:hypothetical protein
MPNFGSTAEVREYAKDLLSRQQKRLQKHIRIERILRLEKWVLEEIRKDAPSKQDDWPTVTSNEPKTLFNAIRRACNKYPVRHQIQLPQLPSDAEHQEINRHEQLLIGAYNDADLLRRRRSMNRLQTDAEWFCSVRGGVFVRPLVLRSAPFTPFRIEIWDPVATVYESGSTGLAFVCHFRIVPKNIVREDYGKEEDADHNGNVVIMDCWWKGNWDDEGDGKAVWNVILSPKRILKGPKEAEEPEEKRKAWGKEPFDDIPVYCIKNGSPAEQKPEADDIGDARQEDAWESILDTNEQLYAWFNRILSLYGLIIRQGAIGPYSVDPTLWKQFGDKIGKMLKPFGIIPGEAKGVTPPAMAVEAREMLSYLQGALQRGGVPFSSFGQVPFELSGFGINQLQGGIEVTALPVAQALEDMFWVSDDEILRQCRRLKGKFRVQGSDNAGKPFLDEIEAAKLDKNYIVDTTMKIALPQDDLMRGQLAQLYDSVGVPKLTIYDQVLELQDPHGEYLRRQKEDMDKDPVLKALAMATAAMAAGQPEKAKYLLIAYAQPLLQANQQGAPGNPPPEVQPPESRGQLAQHEEFQTPPQNIPGEERLAAAGEAVR